MWILKRSIDLISIWKIKSQSGEYEHRHIETERWRWKKKEKRIRSKRRYVERITSTTKISIRKPCRCFSHLFYLSSVIIFRQTIYISSLTCVMLSLFFSLFIPPFLDGSSVVVLESQLESIFSLFSSFFYCRHPDWDWWFSIVCCIDDKRDAKKERTGKT